MQDPTQSGYTIYYPPTEVKQVSEDKQTLIPTPQTVTPARGNYKSTFSKFFIVEDGVISTSLKDQTVLFAVGISIALIAMGTVSCVKGEFECSLSNFPMVSDVLALHMYDRTFIILTTIMTFGVQQVNIRAYYKKLYGIVDDRYNDFLLILGFLPCITLPLIGVFDEHQFNPIHCTCAGIFFGCFAFYCILLARALYQNRDKFPQSEQKAISRMQSATWTMLLLAFGFGISIYFVKSSVPTPFLEWALVLYFVNFFTIASQANAFYDSVHEDGTLIPKP